MNIVEFARAYIDRRGVSAMYAETFVSRARALENHVGRGDVAFCLREDAVNRLLALIAEKRKPSTVKGWRGDLLTLWRAAADEGLVAQPVARRIRRVRVPELVVECFTIDEARAILRAAQGLRGNYANVAKSVYWDAILRTAWDTGLRRGDCWRFSANCFDTHNRWRIVQNKTGRLASGILHDSTADAVRRLGRLDWGCHRNAFTYQFRRLVAASGVNRGTFRWLRRASGSYVELESPGKGAKHLGHAGQEIFRRHYDAGLGAACEGPPEL